MNLPLLKREVLTVKEICERNALVFAKINERVEPPNKEHSKISDNQTDLDKNQLDESIYQQFTLLIKDLYKNQEKERFLESKEHS